MSHYDCFMVKGGMSGRGLEPIHATGCRIEPPPPLQWWITSLQRVVIVKWGELWFFLLLFFAVIGWIWSAWIGVSIFLIVSQLKSLELNCCSLSRWVADCDASNCVTELFIQLDSLLWILFVLYFPVIRLWELFKTGGLYSHEVWL